jgi:DNA-binding transcriptional LysR family regulator
MNFHLEDLLLFTRVAELGTLSAAAREKDVPVSHVTRSLARLEAACGVRLVHRTTHGLSLTDEGDTFLSYGKRWHSPKPLDTFHSAV